MVKYRATSSTDRIPEQRKTNPIDAIGVREGSRTPDIQLRRLALYPTELHEHIFSKFYTDFYTDFISPHTFYHILRVL